MHPALSVILFTTLSGIGYGMLMLIGLFVPAGILPEGRMFGALALGLALGSIGSGLIASTAHLGRPERAWRAFSQWRSSWLSREGVLAVAGFAPAALLLAVWVVKGWAGPARTVPAIVAGLFAVATVFATAMIYRSLKPVPRWSNRWTVPGYLTLALASGALWLQAMAAIGAGRPALPGIWIILFLALAWGTKQLYWRWIDQPQTGGSTMESATGLGHLGRVRPLDPPHTSENYVMKEMGFQIARKHAAKLRRIALAAGFALPVLLIGIGWLVPVLQIPAAILAALIGTLGVLVERWLFFAEARHVALLYYRPDAA